jgi:Cu/Ag efflux pump CusA
VTLTSLYQSDDALIGFKLHENVRALVILVVFLFLQDWRATLIPFRSCLAALA